MKKTRLEYDSLGSVEVPADKLWGAQTQRSLNHFRIGEKASMPVEIIDAFALLKLACAVANFRFGLLDSHKTELITQVCEEIISGKLYDHFPLVIWQTGSGTHTNMNLNEVIANRAHIISGGKKDDTKKVLHPNDDVNKSQSSNDTFPSAMNIAAYRMIYHHTLPAIEMLRNEFMKKSDEFKDIIKSGRTHLMDAAPLTLGQEFSAFSSQLDYGISCIKNAFVHLSELAIGGTAVGTGLNAPKGYGGEVALIVSEMTGLTFTSAPNKFESLSSSDAMVEMSSALKHVAVSLMKIANDIRLAASGPNTAIGELILPANEPGSSIMPGKINPTQTEAITMVCAQVTGNDTAIVTGAMQGHFQLNVFRPMMIYNLLMSARLLGDACISFVQNCVSGIIPETETIRNHMEHSLMLATALNPLIGYDNAAKIALKAYREKKSLRQAAIESGLVNEEEFNKLVDPKKMI